ncbi:LOW QUALITY PROTEIN: 2',3'-cyclic-nucleotide 3'-phosphodiesterase-like [Haliotis rubra]|uniref:LOW QUALITY PROTEIN: 2',3'-cyclic-nucleotide 3'-phosphodiesterase-like n=1 Tax=Haliotis rubra TaxID=36100 RepID=UPI001EE4EEBB|nr:LOW QUALITY PROTEIN: 2',3'-cyclic-nucleotide 3'-phosphodiesterase-like [Haliotis rubra]
MVGQAKKKAQCLSMATGKEGEQLLVDLEKLSLQKEEHTVLKKVDPTLDFPYLTELNTVKHIKERKVMFLLRGLPGSGKSTIVSNLQYVYPTSVKCSADDFFLVKGQYKFDAARLQEAHGWCQTKARYACESGTPVVIIDNTNVRHWEMHFYLNLAHRTNYTAITVIPKTSWRFSPDVLARRNKHGVSEHILREKVHQFENKAPVYYGWFLTEESSKYIRFIAKHLYEECRKHFPDYCRSILEVYRKKYQKPSQENEKSQLELHFPWKSDDLLHCTAKFCNKGRALGASTYHTRQDVADNVGKAFRLEVVGFTFSQNTVAGRICLSEEQRALFDKPEERERDEVIARNKAVNARLAQMSKYQTRIKDKILSPAAATSKPATLTPPKGFGRSAHLTVCCSQGVQNSHTIHDLLDICDMESAGEMGHGVKVAGGEAVYLGEGFCVVYLYRPIYVTTLYSPYHV